MGTTQHDLVVRTMQALGGVASLAELYLAVPRAGWSTTTPEATIRRIVQTDHRIYRIKPGLYGLVAKRRELDGRTQAVTAKPTMIAANEPPGSPGFAAKTQAQLVVFTLERLGGIATLGQLYREVPTHGWTTKTPAATIRKLVQITPEIYKLRPGLYGLKSKRSEFESHGIIAETARNRNSPENRRFDHTYYQGLLLSLGKMRGFECWSPNQDRNKLFDNTALGSVRTLQRLPAFTHPELVKKSSTVDVIWFNERLMPENLFEVEHSTDIYNSLRKFAEFQDFNCNLVIVADAKRRPEFERKKRDRAFRDISKRVDFLSYQKLRTRHEQASEEDGEFQI
jgi:hypothetical protein